MIRWLAAADLASLERLERESLSNPWKTAQLLGSLEQAASLAIGYFLDEDLVAFVLFQKGPGEAELLRVATSPSHRRRGLARELLERGFDELVGSKIDRVHLEVREDNAAARALYRSFGFTEVGRRKDYYPTEVDAVVYTLELEP